MSAVIYTGHSSSHIEPLAGTLHAFQWYTELNDNSREIRISIPSAFKELSIICFVIAAKANANTRTEQTPNKKLGIQVPQCCRLHLLGLIVKCILLRVEALGHYK